MPAIVPVLLAVLLPFLRFGRHFARRAEALRNQRLMDALSVDTRKDIG